MRLFASLVAALVMASAAVTAATTNNLASLPSCSLTCMATLVSNSSCALDDTTCVCTNKLLVASIEKCVAASCTPKEMLTTMNVTSTNCGVVPRDKRRTYDTVSITLGIITGIVVAVRISFKLFVIHDQLNLSDIFILATMGSGIPSTVMNTTGLTKHGLARDIWTVPFDDITLFGRYYYVMEVLYFTHVTLLKLSILFFYLRIFPAPAVRRLLWATVAVVAAFGLAFVIAAIFQCSPISYFWTKWSGETTGSCVSINHLAWANAAGSILLDLCMLAIPLSQLRHLKLHWKKKLGVGLMFCTGTFVTVMSVVRLHSLIKFANSHNTTWDQWEAALWSTIEINIGIICACMPSIRVVLVRLFPRVFDSTFHDHGKGSYYASDQYKRSMPQDSAVSGGLNGTGTLNNVHGNGDSGGISTPTGSHHRAVECDHNVNRGAIDPSGILCSRTYTVKYGADLDETSLVQMADLDRESAKSSSSISDSYEHKVPMPSVSRMRIESAGK
ncbi:hypothetical protein CFIMG_002317RA [Ceratocystis fimbriata CBS 114723]|uniref:CFEM domain-containing protein n=1 Tax=Ceratocystis fimbriata CBS 114723 TaxID=1035309 RepID=A0A2C5X401_9PEZI|nr:hypothetical protein CFIMG_002317RA [Ceratocystis fimbriata CBS 114723]